VSLDVFFDRVYDRHHYSCWHFAAEVWLALTGENLQGRMEEVLQADMVSKRLKKQTVRKFESLDKPVSPSIAIMKKKGAPLHVGIYVRGGIIHIHPRGVEFFPPKLASRGFETVRYYR
jgi:hypothetical protein